MSGEEESDDTLDDLLFPAELVADPVANEAVESDEERQIRLRKELEECVAGCYLYTCIITRLPSSGSRVGSCITMNRALVYLKSVELCEAATPTWANCRKAEKDAVCLIFANVLADTVIFAALKSSVLEGFIAKKVAGKGAAKKHEVLILDEQDETTVKSGRVVDRLALLACALVDPHLTPMFAEIAAPIEAALRPAFLDLGATHATLARWTVIAEAIMRRRDGYSNPFKEVTITGHGNVLEDIDPSNGVFYSSGSTPMGKQLKDLLTCARTQNMLLDGRIFKSGYNSTSTDLIDQAYLRTGLENRPKDIGRFYFWMTVRGKDLDFLVASLNEDESASQSDGNGCVELNPQETTYAKRKRREGENQKLVKKEQIDLFRELMSPDSITSDSSNTPCINDSIVQKNLAYANNKRVTAIHTEAMTIHTEAMTATEKVNNLLKVMNNATVWSMYSEDEQLTMQEDLKMLIRK